LETHLLEFRILSLLRNRNAFLKYSSILKEHLFGSKHTKYIYKLLLFYHRQIKSKTTVPLSSLFTLVSSRIKENEAEKYKEIIRKVKKFPFADEAIADDIVRKFAQRQLLKIMIMDALQGLDRDEHLDIAKLRSRLDEALVIDSTEVLETAYNYFSNPMQRMEEDRNKLRIPTYLSPEIDRAMDQGLSTGELALIMAPTKVGKTMFLLNIAYNAVKHGKKVVYVTLELSKAKIASRFDQLVTRKPKEYLNIHPGIVFKYIKKLKTKGGGLMIKDCTSARLSPVELGLYLERLRKDFEFDMVVVDQVDLMYSPKEYKERRYELSSIVVSLRRMGATMGIPVWAATQANRAAGEAGVTTLWDIAEDIGKANWADIILALSQSPEDKEENIMWLDVVGNRIGESNPRVMLTTNYTLMSLKGNVSKPKEKE